MGYNVCIIIDYIRLSRDLTILAIFCNLFSNLLLRLAETSHHGCCFITGFSLIFKYFCIIYLEMTYNLNLVIVF